MSWRLHSWEPSETSVKREKRRGRGATAARWWWKVCSRLPTAPCWYWWWLIPKWFRQEANRRRQTDRQLSWRFDFIESSFSFSTWPNGTRGPPYPPFSPSHSFISFYCLAHEQWQTNKIFLLLLTTRWNFSPSSSTSPPDTADTGQPTTLGNIFNVRQIVFALFHLLQVLNLL